MFSKTISRLKAKFFVYSLVILAGVTAAPLEAQLLIAPTSVFLDEGRRITTVMVMNQTNETREIDLAMKFGYPRCDTFGNKRMTYGDSTLESRYSLAEWVRIFPRKFTLQPGEKQNVRVMAMPPASLPAGSYWGRLFTRSMLRSTLNTDAGSNVGAELNFAINQVIPVLFKKGEAQPQLEAGKGHRSFIDSANIYLVNHLRCSQNPPFYGTAQCRVYNNAGELIDEQELPLSVYFEEFKRFTLARENYPPGTYAVELTLSPKRPNIDERFLIAMDPVVENWTFTVQNPSRKGM